MSNHSPNNVALYLMCCVILAQPVVAAVLNNSSAPVSTTVLVACFGAAMFVLIALIIAIVLFAWRRHVRRRNALQFHPIDDTTLPPIKKRVVLMHSNMLYAQEPSSNEKGKFLLGSNNIAAHRTPLLISQIAPQVRIEHCCTRSRLSSELTSMSEYEIPLDAKWEFPRER
jgi:hypothetical protein